MPSMYTIVVAHCLPVGIFQDATLRVLEGATKGRILGFNLIRRWRAALNIHIPNQSIDQFCFSNLSPILAQEKGVRRRRTA